MIKKFFSSSRNKIIVIVSCIVVIILSLFIINKIQITPSQYVLSAPEKLEVRATSPSEELSASSETSTAIVKEEYPKQVIVSLKSWSDTESAKGIIIENGGQIIKVLNWPTKNVIVASLPDKNAEEGILKNSFWAKLVGGIGFSSLGNKLSGGVDSIEQDVEVYPNAQAIDWGAVYVKADKVWSASGGNKGAGVKIAILDTGVQRDHPDLIANIKGGINFTTISEVCWDEDYEEEYACGTVYPDKWDDDQGHGTGMAGIIAAVDNNTGIVGIAPEASLYIVKVLGGTSSTGSMSDVISGIYWTAQNGMDIANMSVGSPSYSREYETAVNYAYERGVLLVASTGNDGALGLPVNYPAAFPNVIAVGSISLDYQRANSSSYGPEVELVAPGDGVISTQMGSTYDFSSGTSDAAPMVSGVAALILSKYPDWTPAQVRAQLTSTAIDLGAPGRDNYYGYGLVNALDSMFARPAVAITLITPTGGERWMSDVQHEISWSTVNLLKEDTLNIQLIDQDSEISYPIGLNMLNIGSVLLTIPDDQPTSDNYVIEISCASNFIEKCQSARSGAFSIFSAPTDQALTIAYPNGGEKLPQGTTQSVEWNANYFGGTNADITLLEKKQIPIYSFVSNVLSLNSDKYTCFDPLNCPTGYGGPWSVYDPSGLTNIINPGIAPVPPPSDTCGSINQRDFCPTTYASEHFTCTDVSIENLQSKGGIRALARTVDCAYKQGSQTNSCYDSSSCFSWYGGFTVYDPQRLYSSAFDAEVKRDAAPPDTCDGGIGKFFCPATYSSANYTCTDVWRGAKARTTYWARTVNCTYMPVQSGSYEATVPIRTLAENVVNKGSAEITVPSDISGNKYKIQLTCSKTFSGECTEGLSADLFSIVSLTDPQVLVIHKNGIGAVTDGNIRCGIDRGACLENYEKGAVVNLTADTTSNPNLIFSGWTGDCSGTGTCQIKMDSARDVTATFSNKFITLTAKSTDPLSTFSGWSGECIENGMCRAVWTQDCGDNTTIPCNVTVAECNSDQSVSPMFDSMALSAPRDLRAEYVKERRGLKLSWRVPGSNGGSAITGYKVDRYIGNQGVLCGDLSPTVPTSLFLSKVTTTTIIDNINYEQGSCYVYSVRAININGAGPSSEVRYRTTGTSIKGPFTLTGVGFTSGVFGGVNIYDDAKNSLACSGWQVQDSKTIINGSCEVPDTTPIGELNISVTIGKKTAVLKYGLTISPPLWDQPPSDISFIPETAIVSVDNKIRLNTIIGKNILGGAAVKLVNINNPNQQIECFDISEQTGYRADGLSELNGGDCDTSNIGFTIPSTPTYWKMFIKNSVTTNKYEGSSAISLSTECDPVANCKNTDGTIKECGSNGCGGFCSNNNNINDIAVSCTKNVDFGTCSVAGAGIKTCSSGKYGACENIKVENPIIKNCTNTDETKKECGSDSCGGLCGGGPVAASCVKSNAFGTCSGIGTKTCASGNYGDCTVTQTDPRIANCLGRQCGGDLCGGYCGNLKGDCPSGKSCNIDNGICESQSSAGEGSGGTGGSGSGNK